MRAQKNGSRDGGRQMQRACLLLAAMTVVGVHGTARAGSFDLFGLSGGYQLFATYSAAVRLEDQAGALIDAPPSAKIPLPDAMKVSESYNYDDGNRNFNKGSLINNRLSVLGEITLGWNDYSLLLRGDAFYDGAYHGRNDNRSPATINKTVNNFDEFSPDARHFGGGRARMLDAVLSGNWSLTDEMVLSVTAGRQVVAWGESLFFSGIALAQGPADATKANVPGADVKSILLPVSQIAMNLTLTDKLTLVGQYKLEYQETQLTPVGDFFSPADIVGPGREFIYGIKNPLYVSNLAAFNLASRDPVDIANLVVGLLGINLLPGQVTGAAGSLLDQLNRILPDINVPLGQVQQPGVPQNINVYYAGDIKPSDHGQWGAGLTYQATPITNIGLYHLRYHNTTPAPVQNYGFAVLLPGNGVVPDITTQVLALKTPVTYNIKYFDGIHMTAASFSTVLFGANVAGEFIYRDGVDVLVDVDGGLLGPVPTPSRARMGQIDLNAIYVIGPGWFWDGINLVGNIGYNHIIDVDEATGPDPDKKFTTLTYSRDASAYSILAMIDKRNIFDGWDLQIPITHSGVISGQSSFLGGFGPLAGDSDYRAGIGFNFTWLQKLTLGISYSAYFGGKPDLQKRPYTDRDNAGFIATYRF